MRELLTVRELGGIHEALGSCHPKLSRNQVWCRKCGKTQKVDSGKCFKTGWPLCCGQTMTIDSPEEQKAQARAT